jgi:hypothetical protein
LVAVQGQHILCKDRKGPLHIFLCECQLKFAYKNKQQSSVFHSFSASAIESGKQHKVYKKILDHHSKQNILSYISKF